MGIQRTQKLGDVFLHEFDKGIVESLGGVIIGDDYYIPTNVIGVEPPLYTILAGDQNNVGKPMPGIPIIFGNPEDSVQRYVISCIRVRAEDPSPAMERWGSLDLKYRAPAPGAEEITVEYGNRTLTGYNKYETQPGAWPYDLPYTITVEAAGKSARTKAQKLLRYCMKKFGPYSVVSVVDSEGRIRKYNVFGEGPSSLDLVGDIRERTIIYALSLRISGELDVQDSMEHRAVTSTPTVTGRRREEYDD